MTIAFSISAASPSYQCHWFYYCCARAMRRHGAPTTRPDGRRPDEAFDAFADLMSAGHAQSIGVVLQKSRFRELFPNVPLHFY